MSEHRNIKVVKKIKPHRHVRPSRIIFGVIAGTVILGIGFGAWWYGDKTAADNFTEKITILEFQVGDLSKKLNEANAKISESKAKDEKSISRQYLTIKEWGVRFPLDESISDAYYVLDDNNALLTTKKISDSATECNVYAGGSNANSIGMLVRTSPSAKDEMTKQNIQKRYPEGVVIGDYFYYYDGPQATCGENNADAETIAYEGLKAALMKLQPVE